MTEAINLYSTAATGAEAAATEAREGTAVMQSPLFLAETAADALLGRGQLLDTMGKKARLATTLPLIS